MARAVRASVRIAATAAQREGAITAWRRDAAPTDGPKGRLVIAEGALVKRSGPRGVPIVGLAAGCVCCVGWVSRRVALTGALRAYRPHELLLLVMSETHLPRLRDVLANGGFGITFDRDVPA